MKGAYCLTYSKPGKRDLHHLNVRLEEISPVLAAIRDRGFEINMINTPDRRTIFSEP